MCQIASEIIKLVIFSPSINFQSYGKGFRSQSRMVWPGESTHIKNIFITPCASATAIGGTIDHVSIEYNVSKGTGGVTGRNFIFFRQIDILFI